MNRTITLGQVLEAADKDITPKARNHMELNGACCFFGGIAKVLGIGGWDLVDALDKLPAIDTLPRGEYTRLGTQLLLANDSTDMTKAGIAAAIRASGADLEQPIRVPMHGAW